MYKRQYKLTADKDEAENLLQETMLRTLDNKDKFDSGTNFKGWMYTIMRNAVINNCRTKKIRGNLYVLSEPEYHLSLIHICFQFIFRQELTFRHIRADVELGKRFFRY